MYKIRNKATGQFFVKVNRNAWVKRADGNNYKTATFNDTGKILMNEVQLNSALNALTKERNSDKLPYPIYPAFTLDDLEIVDLSKEVKK